MLSSPTAFDCIFRVPCYEEKHSEGSTSSPTHTGQEIFTMSNKLYFWIVVAVISAVYFPFYTDAIKCVQCTTCRNSYPKATECPLNLTFCLKIVTEDGETVERKCSPIPQNETKSICVETFDRDTTCKHYCNNKDGCNTASAALAPQLHWIILFLIISAISHVPPYYEYHHRKFMLFGE